MMHKFWFILMTGILFHGSGSAQFGMNVKRTYNETNHQIYTARYSDGGHFIVTAGSDNNVIIWYAETGKIFRTYADLKKRPNVALYKEDKGILITGGEDQVVTMWNPETLKTITSFHGHSGAVKSLDISPDGQYLASGSTDKTVRIWNLASQNLVYELKAHKKGVNSVQFSPDGTKLVSAGAGRKLILWDLENGNILKSVEAHKGWISDVSFSPDGQSIASCGYDKLIHIWNTSDLRLKETLEGHKAWVQSIKFSPDGRYLISGGHDELIIFWSIENGNILFQSEKQGQIVLSVDISPIKPDLITSCLMSEALKIWAMYGMDLAQWKVEPSGTEVEKDMLVKKEILVAEDLVGKKNKTDTGLKPGATYPLIDIFNPVIEQERAINKLNEVSVIGRVSDPAGVNAFLINKTVVRLTEAGVFQHHLRLYHRENPIQLVAINNNGKMTERNIIVTCELPLSSKAGAESSEIDNGIYYALLIGVNEYYDENITNLDNPVADAEALNRILVLNYTFDSGNVILLRDPTRSEIIKTLDDLSQKLSGNDNLLIFYAGHGYWDSKGDVGYWFPSDANRNSTSNWFRNSTLRDFIGSIQSRHTILIADACFSGAIFKTRAAFTEPSQGIRKLYELPSRKAMTSGILQEVPDKSVFVRFLLKKLEENNEKYVSSEILFSSFKTAIMNNSNNVPQFGTIQNVGDEGGDFIFIRRQK